MRQAGRGGFFRHRAVRGLLATGLALATASTGLVAGAGLAFGSTPVPPAVNDPAPLRSKDPSPTWTFDSDPAVDYECAVVAADGSLQSPWADCTSRTALTSYRPSTPLTVDGAYVFRVREGAGAAEGSSSAYVYDTVATGTATPDAAVTNDTTPHWTIAPENGNSRATCTLPGGTATLCDTEFTAPDPLPEGVTTLRVDFRDDLGNTGSVDSAVTVDTTAPTQPVPVTTSASPTNVGPVAWTFSLDGDERTVTCTLFDGSGPLRTASCLSGPGATSGTFSFTPADEGTYGLTVTATDAAGNTSAGTTAADQTVTWDVTAPAAQILSGPPSTPTTTPDATWTLTTPGSSTSCSLSDGTTTKTLDCQSGTAAFTGLTSGTWTLTVTSTDSLGNTAVTLPKPTYVVDLLGPDAPAVAGPSGLSNTPDPAYTVTPASDATSTECRVVGTATVGGADLTTAWGPCSGVLSTPQDGTYSLEARSVDSLGNVGPTGASAAYVYDGTAPAAPDWSGVPATTNTLPVFPFALGTGDAATCTTTSGSTTVESLSSCGPGYTPALTADGTYTVTVVLTDAAGNSRTVSRDVTYDRAAPGIVTLSTTTASPSNALSVTWSIGSDGSPLTCSIAPAVPLTGCGTQVTADLTGAPDGSYTLTVTATDDAGNTRTATANHEVDRSSPGAPAVTAPPTPGNANPAVWSFTQDPSETAQCRLVAGLTPGLWQPCSNGTFPVADLADGTYSVEVTLTDAAGNTSPVGRSGRDYTSDRTAPADPVVSGPSGPGNVPDVTWSWTGELVRADCRLETGGVAGAPFDCTGGSFRTTLADGSYRLSVQLTDRAGNSSGVVTTPTAYVLDTVRPITPSVAGPSGYGRDPAPSWSFGAEPGSLVECALLTGTVQGPWSTCGSPYLQTLTADGTYRLAVRVTDAAGNVSLTGLSDPYLYDATAPSSPVVVAPASPSAQRSPSWTFSGDPAVTSECRLERGGLLVQDWAACTSPFTDDLTGQPDGSYVLLVRDADAAGNTSAPGQAPLFVLDTQAPTAPVVTGPTGPSTDARPVFTWTGEPGASATCGLLLDGVARGAAVACSSPYAPTLGTDGRWQLSVALTDLAGNTGPASPSGAYVFDSTPPDAPVVTAPASPGRNTRPSWSAVYEAGATTECRLPGSTVLPDWSACALPLTTDLTGLADGDYTLEVRVTDAAGQTGPVGSATYRLDTKAPAAPVFTTVPASPSRKTTVGVAFTGEAGSTFTCRLVGPKISDPEAPCASPLTLNLAAPDILDGAYTLAVFATDAAGNAGARASTTYVLDRAGPAAPFLLTGPASVTPDRTPVWTFSGEPGVTYSCRLVGSAVGLVADAACTSPYAPSALPSDDVYTLTVQATDSAGNASAPLTTTFQLDSTAPVTPDVTGPTSPGRLTAPTWLLSAPSGTVQCRLVKGSTVLRDWANCGRTFTRQLVEGDGLYVLGARVLSATGTTSAEVLSRYLLDTAPPAAAVLTAPASPGTDRRLTWTVTSTDAGASAQCQVLGVDSRVLKAFAPCGVSTAGAPYLLDLTGAVDGTYTLVVRLTDLAGNVGPDATSAYVLDTGPPNTVLVTNPPSPGTQTAPRWSLVGDSDATLECKLTGTQLPTGAFLPCTADPAVPGLGSFTADLTFVKGDGTFQLTVRSRDSAGNLGPEATGTYVLDVTPPLPASVPVPPPSPAREPTISWTFTYETGATALCTLSSATNPSVLPERVCTSPWTTDLGPFGDGDYRLSVRVVDLAGNPSPAVSGRYVLDRTPSAAPSLVGTPANVSPDTTPTWYVEKAEPQDTLECQLVGLTGSTWSACGTTVIFDLGQATAGSYVLQVRELDPVGNPSLVTSSGTYRLDTTAPWTAEVLPPSPQRANGLTPVFTIVRQPEDKTTVRLVCAVARFDGGPASAAPCDFGQSTVDLGLAPALAGDGDVLLTVRTVDGAGRTSPRASGLYRFDNVPPAIPTVLALGPDHGFGDTATWTISPADPTDTFTCTLTRQGVVVGTPGPCTTGLTETFPSFGQYVLTVRSVDLAGNTSLTAAQSSYTYLPPVPTAPTPRGPAAGADATPTWTFPVPAGYRAVCSLSGPGGAALLQDVDCRTGSFTPSLPSTAGTYTLSVVLRDAFNNAGPPSKQSYRYTPAAVLVGHITTPQPPGSPVPPARPPVGRPVVPPVVPPDVGTPTTVTVDPLPPRGVPSVVGQRPATTLPGIRRPAIPAPALQDVPRLITKAVTGLGQRPTIPLVLLSIVVGFLLLQSRIDRRDPKLAAAPVGTEPELEFGPVLRARPTAAGGARP